MRETSKLTKITLITGAFMGATLLAPTITEDVPLFTYQSVEKVAHASLTEGTKEEINKGEMVDYVNNYRSEENDKITESYNNGETEVPNYKNELVENEEMNGFAEWKARDMANNSYHSHNTPEGKTVKEQYLEYAPDTKFIYGVGENIMATNRDLTEEEFKAYAFTTWKNSEGHNKNMLREDYTDFGYGHYVNEDTGWQYGVQIYGIDYENQPNYNVANGNENIINQESYSSEDIEEYSEGLENVPRLGSDGKPYSQAEVMSNNDGSQGYTKTPYEEKDNKTEKDNGNKDNTNIDEDLNKETDDRNEGEGVDNTVDNKDNNNKTEDVEQGDLEDLDSDKEVDKEVDKEDNDGSKDEYSVLTEDVKEERDEDVNEDNGKIEVELPKEEGGETPKEDSTETPVEDGDNITTNEDGKKGELEDEADETNVNDRGNTNTKEVLGNEENNVKDSKVEDLKVSDLKVVVNEEENNTRNNKEDYKAVVLGNNREKNTNTVKADELEGKKQGLPDTGVAYNQSLLLGAVSFLLAGIMSLVVSKNRRRKEDN